MKKKIIALCFILVLIPILTACVRLETTATVNADGTVDIRTFYAICDPYSEGPYELSEKEILAYAETGFTYEAYPYDEDGYSGYILTKEGIDINSLSNRETGLENLMVGNIFTVDGKHIVIDFVPFPESEYGDEEDLGAVPDELESDGYMTFILELPVKASKHNATSVSNDKKTLTWDLATMNVEDHIYVEFNLSSGFRLIWLFAGIGVLAIIVAVVAVMIVRKKKKRDLLQKTPIEETQKEEREAQNKTTSE